MKSLFILLATATAAMKPVYYGNSTIVANALISDELCCVVLGAIHGSLDEDEPPVDAKMNGYSITSGKGFQDVSQVANGLKATGHHYSFLFRFNQFTWDAMQADLQTPRERAEANQGGDKGMIGNLMQKFSQITGFSLNCNLVSANHVGLAQLCYATLSELAEAYPSVRWDISFPIFIQDGETGLFPAGGKSVLDLLHQDSFKIDSLTLDFNSLHLLSNATSQLIPMIQTTIDQVVEIVAPYQGKLELVVMVPLVETGDLGLIHQVVSQIGRNAHVKRLAFNDSIASTKSLQYAKQFLDPSVVL